MRLMIALPFSLLLSSVFAFPATIKVPGDYPTIQLAIDASVKGDTVLAFPGTYVENIDFKGKAITVRSNEGADVTVIDGGKPLNPDIASTVTFVSNEGSDSILDGFTICNGKGTYKPSKRYGGGIYCRDGSSPTIQNNVITLNAANVGGGICCWSSANPLIQNNLICSNSSGIGGKWASPTITNNIIDSNGSGIDICPGHLKVTHNIISNNGYGITVQSHAYVAFNRISGNHSGGIQAVVGYDIVISKNIIENNGNPSGSSIGGVYSHYGAPTIENNIIRGNSTGVAYGGGGIKCSGNYSPRISGNIIYGNSSGRGGGIFCTSDAFPFIQNNIIFDNHVVWYGGGIYCYHSSPVISNNTLYGNTADEYGGGLCAHKGAAVTMTNSILWNNDAPIGPEMAVITQSSPSAVTLGYSDVKGGKASVHVDPKCTLNWDPGMIDKDPYFVPGPKGFYYLGQGAAGQPADSPCVDAGSDLAVNLGMDAYWTRTDGVPDAGTVDMGYHYGDFIFPTLQTDTLTLSEGTGGDADFLLLAGTENASRGYILLGSVSGTDPGIPLPGGKATLPLNWDAFMDVMISALNTPVFHNFLGVMDATGSANARLDTLGPIPGTSGIVMHFAYALDKPWDFVSYPVAIKIVP